MMTGHRLWHTIRKKSRRCDSISPSSNIACGLYWGHEGLHTSEDRTVTWGYGGFAENQEKTNFSSDVGDEHVERQPPQDCGYQPIASGPPPTQPPPKPADAAQSVIPPRYRRTPFVSTRDQEQVEGMLKHTRPRFIRHTRPLGLADAKPVAPGDMFPIPPDEIEYQYPYQDEAVDVLKKFIRSHINAYKMVHAGYLADTYDTYRHEPEGCKHCEAKSALDLLNGIIQTQAKKLREYEDAMAIQYEMYGDPEDLLKRAEEAEAALISCNVDLHNSKQHELGLMCGELTEKLNKIAKLVDDNEHVGLSSFLASDIREILED
jgi:hypothetical protein